MKTSKYINSPLGQLLATANENGICEVAYTQDQKPLVEVTQTEGEEGNTPGLKFLAQLESELSEYFTGKRKEFTVPIDLEGTEFQIKVWNKLKEIPYGKTVTYAKLADMVESKNAVRAVGGANSRNPVMILIPCHRVNGAQGKLTGYSGGLYAKKFLLDLESGKRSPVQTVLMFP